MHFLSIPSFSFALPWEIFPLCGLLFQPIFLACFFRVFFSQYFGLLFFHRFFSPSINSLPTFNFPPLANLSNSLDHFFSLFIQPAFSTCFFRQFSATFSILWVSSFNSLYQILHSLPPPMVFQPFSNLFPFFLHSLSLPCEFSTLLDIFFQPIFQPFG